MTVKVYPRGGLALYSAVEDPLLHGGRVVCLKRFKCHMSHGMTYRKFLLGCSACLVFREEDEVVSVCCVRVGLYILCSLGFVFAVYCILSERDPGREMVGLNFIFISI